VGTSSKAVHHQSRAGPVFQSCPRASDAVQRLGKSVDNSRGGTALIPDRLLFRPDISPVGANRTRVMRCRQSPMTAVGCCCCCLGCCQRMLRSHCHGLPADGSVTPWSSPPSPGLLPADLAAPRSVPGPSPEPDSCRTIRQPGSVRGRRLPHARCRGRRAPPAWLVAVSDRLHACKGCDCDRRICERAGQEQSRLLRE
jgi:hypothetical protein